MVDNNSAEDLQNAGRLKQIRMVAGLINQQNRKAMPIIIGSAVGIIVVCVLVGLFTELAAFLIPLGVLLGLLAAMILFGRFAQRAQYSMIEGQPGAAAAVLQGMRGNWTVTPAVTANRNLDVVHRAVGRAGVVLVGEGAPSRLAGLMAAEKKKTARVAHDVPIFEFQVGNERGPDPGQPAAAQDHAAAAQPAPGRGQRPQLPAEGAPAEHADAEGPAAQGRPPAADAAAEGPLTAR